MKDNHLLKEHNFMKVRHHLKTCNLTKDSSSFNLMKVYSITLWKCRYVYWQYKTGADKQTEELTSQEIRGTT